MSNLRLCTSKCHICMHGLDIMSLKPAKTIGVSHSEIDNSAVSNINTIHIITHKCANFIAYGVNFIMRLCQIMKYLYNCAPANDII